MRRKNGKKARAGSKRANGTADYEREKQARSAGMLSAALKQSAENGGRNSLVQQPPTQSLHNYLLHFFTILMQKQSLSAVLL